MSTPTPYNAIMQRIAKAMTRRPNNLMVTSFRLLAVSKLQSIDSIVECYKCGQRFFGENYIQELVSKANDQKILSECPDINWYLIGHLQSKKVNLLKRIPQLKGVESIDSLKTALAIDKTVPGIEIMVQINTSNEENKFGVPPEQAIELIKQIRDKCQTLNIRGLMTIGLLDRDPNVPNPDFQCLIDCGQRVKEETGLDLELSFGMSDTFEMAIEMGSNEVRIGTALFGNRQQKS